MDFMSVAQNNERERASFFLPVAADAWCKHSDLCVHRERCKEPCFAFHSQLPQPDVSRAELAQKRLTDFVNEFGLDAVAKRLGRTKHSLQKTLNAPAKLRDRTINQIEKLDSNAMNRRWAETEKVRLAAVRIRYLSQLGVDTHEISRGCHCSETVIAQVLQVSGSPVENATVLCLIDWCNKKISEVEKVESE